MMKQDRLWTNHRRKMNEMENEENKLDKCGYDVERILKCLASSMDIDSAHASIDLTAMAEELARLKEMKKSPEHFELVFKNIDDMMKSMSLYIIIKSDKKRTRVMIKLQKALMKCVDQYHVKIHKADKYLGQGIDAVSMAVSKMIPMYKPEEDEKNGE